MVKVLDTILSESAYSAEIDVPLEKIDVADWLFSLPEAEYLRCCPPDHIAAGVTWTDDGRRMSINVEQIGSGLVVQHYVAEVAEPAHCRMNSISDVFTANGRTQVNVVWELIAEKIDDGRTRYTNKGAVSLVLGLLLSTVGLDVTTGQPRFTFDVLELSGGISFIPVMIGMFAFSEILRGFTALERELPSAPKVGDIKPYRGMFAVLRQYPWSFIRGTTLGSAVGALPGVGGDLAASIAYGVSRKFSKTPEKFGTGHPEGLIEATSSNNAGLSSAWNRTSSSQSRSYTSGSFSAASPRPGRVAFSVAASHRASTASMAA